MEDEKSQAQAVDESSTKKNLVDPFEYLSKYPNAPTKVQVEQWKAQAPNGSIRLLALGKNVDLVRGISGLELQALQLQIPDNLGVNLNPEARAAKIEAELALLVGSRCVVWTSRSADGKLTVEQLRAGSAGLPGTLFALVTYLSDFIDPEAFSVISAEL